MATGRKMPTANYERITVVKQDAAGRLSVHQGWRLAKAGRKNFLDPDAEPIMKGPKP
jgi:hypothetical protein